jgi:protoporphyrinogen oxidase
MTTDQPNSNVKGGTAIIIGAGPAGLTAAYELLDRTSIHPIVLEKSDCMGGLARTIVYKGNRIDIGPHRFFSKSDRVMDWWMKMIPLQPTDGKQEITYRRSSREVQSSPDAPNPATDDRVMLTLNRKTRIYYMRKFFDYPISLSLRTLSNMGVLRTFRIGISYMKSAAFPIGPETNLEHFLINRFGKELYLTFFKDYTEKVWGIPCDQISASWGAQRIKGLSITKAVMHALRKMVAPIPGLSQKETETSLVERFMFPKLGAGQMWEETAKRVKEKGGEIVTHCQVNKILIENNQVKGVEVTDTRTGEKKVYEGQWFFSTMPIKELVNSLDCEVPPFAKEISNGLVYRDFVEVGLLVKKLKVRNPESPYTKLIEDNWIYIQESDVLVGRMQVWNNWGPAMVADPNKVWLGMEYFCYEKDDVWNLPDDKMIALASMELAKIGIIDEGDVEDAMVIRMPKTYPGYFGTYDRFEELRQYLDGFTNLFLVGRNGQHKYNNQDHSMLASMVAVDNISAGITDKENVWAVNTEQEYHEEKSDT